MHIKFISSYLPKNYRSINFLKKSLGKNYNRVLNYTGYKKIHVLKEGNSIQQFIFNSIRNFLKSNQINAKNIDCIIYSSHTRPSEMPNFSISIQKKFNLRNEILAYDLPNSCSAFTNGLIHSHAMLKSAVVKNVLLICSDFHSTKLNKKNKNLVPVIGDGISCIYIKKDEKNLIKFDFGVEGNENSILKIENESLSMDGIKVFEFAVDKVPKTVARILTKAKNLKKKIDFVVLHQPNKNIFENLIKKLSIDNKKFISNYNHGNLSAASIPVNICKNFPNKIIRNKTFLFVGFGSGLSWSSIIMKLNRTKVEKIIYL